MISSNLEAECSELLSKIEAIQSSGPIAPPKACIAPDFLSHKNWVLNSVDLPMRERHLGQAGSPKYMDWVERIRRRDQLTELQQQLTLLRELMARQASADGLFVKQTHILTVGDWVEFNNQRYQVHEIGSVYVQLENANKVITRCKIDQVRILESEMA